MGQLYQWEPFTEGAVSSPPPAPPAGPTQVWAAPLSLLVSHFSGQDRDLAQTERSFRFAGSDGWEVRTGGGREGELSRDAL